MPDDSPRRRLTVADLAPIARIPAATQGEPAAVARKPFAIGQARPPAAAPQRPPQAAKPPPGKPAPPRIAKPPQPAPRPAAKPVEAKPAKPPPPVYLSGPVPGYVPPPVPQAVTRDADGFPCGWCFGDDSWGFHRALWFEHGIRLELGEYGAIRRQCYQHGGGEKLGRNIWRVTLASGRQIIVSTRRGQLMTVLPDAGWETFHPWVASLIVNMPDPEPQPTGPRERTPTQKTARRRKKAARKARDAAKLAAAETADT